MNGLKWKQVLIAARNEKNNWDVTYCQETNSNDSKMLTWSFHTTNKNLYLDKEHITICTELAVKLFCGLWYTHTELPCHPILSLSVAARKFLRGIRLGWFPLDFPCGSSIGLRTWQVGPTQSQGDWRKKDGCSCQRKSKGVSGGTRCLSSSEEWGKTSPHPALKTSLPLFPYTSFCNCLKTKGGREGKMERGS